MSGERWVARYDGLDIEVPVSEEHIRAYVAACGSDVVVLGDGVVRCRGWLVTREGGAPTAIDLPPANDFEDDTGCDMCGADTSEDAYAGMTDDGWLVCCRCRDRVVAS